MFKQWWVTVGLVVAILLIGVKIVQLSLAQHAPPPPALSFSCAVAVDYQIGELCVRGPFGASVSVEVHYCDGSHIQSPQIRSQVDGEYRWVWIVRTACRGKASATALALWPDHRQSEAIALFDVV